MENFQQRNINIVTSESPVIHTEIMYAHPNRIPHFPSLSAITGIRHGFTWGTNSANHSYNAVGKLFADNPEKLLQAEQQVTQNTLHILHLLDMGTPDNMVIATGDDDSKRRDVTREWLIDQRINRKDKKDYQDGWPQERALISTTGALFTTDLEIILAEQPGDCHGTLACGITREGKPVVGIVHSGRKGVDIENGYNAIQHMISYYGCNPAEIRLGITPSLGIEHHRIRYEDEENELKNPLWQQYSERRTDGLYVDMLPFLIDQYLWAGILPQNMEIYDIDTFTAAKEGKTFSHRYAIQPGNDTVLDGRMLVAIQIAR